MENSIMNAKVMQAWVATRWGKPHLELKQLIPLQGAPWEWQADIIPGPSWMIQAAYVAMAETDAGFGDWLVRRGGALPVETVEQQLKREGREWVDMGLESEQMLAARSAAYCEQKPR
jgi:hypothetical protein